MKVCCLDVRVLVGFCSVWCDGLMHQTPSPQAFGPVVPRVRDVLAHIPIYSGRSITQLAEDAGVSKSAISRLLNKEHNPSFAVVARVANAIERRTGRRIDLRDLVAEDGDYPTSFVCRVVGCTGCIPEAAFDEFGDRKQAFADVTPGRWVSSRAPRKEAHE